jgi:hypothetical protein
MKPIGIEDLTTEQQEKVRKLSELLEVSTEQAIGALATVDEKLSKMIVDRGFERLGIN